MLPFAVARAAIAPVAPLPAAEPAPAAHPFAELLKQNRDAAAQVPQQDAPSAPAASAAHPLAGPPPQADAAAGAPAAPVDATAGDASTQDAPAKADGSASVDDAAAGAASQVRDGAGKARARAPMVAKAPSSTRDDEGREGRAMREERHAARTGHPSPAPADATPPGSRAPAVDAAAPSRADASSDDGPTLTEARAGVDPRASAAADAAPRIDSGRMASQADGRFVDALASASVAATLEATPAQAPSPLSAGPLAPAAATMAPAAPAAPAPPDAPGAASVPAPIDAPEFAHAFAVQVSILASEGVQRAELHLNPAELGPVSVHLTLEGTQATVDFGAAHAVTRHAIEAGLPELASTLRDAGFTLAGGGVSSQTGDRDRGARADGDAGSAPAADDTRTGALDAAPAGRRLVRAGGVDLYA
jgi:flagellar hook-length control protein FliK